MTDHPLTFTIKVNVTNYNKVQTTGFSTEFDNFHLAARLMDNTDSNPVDLSIPSYLLLYRQDIPSGGSIAVDVQGNMSHSFYDVSRIVCITFDIMLPVI